MYANVCIQTYACKRFNKVVTAIMRQTTIKDVAQRAGVSPSTVSRLLNDRLPIPISPKVRERILQAVRELNYAPHASARALVLRCTQTIGLIVYDITHPFYGALVQEVQSRLEERGYHLILCSANLQSAGEAHYTRLVTESRADGILLMGSTGTNPVIAQQLRSQANLPIIGVLPLLRLEMKEVYTAWVEQDSRRGGFLVGQHLGQLGHERVGYLAAGGFCHYHSGLRLEGLQEGLAACGVSEAVRLVEPMEHTTEGGRRATLAMLEQHPEVTAIFAYSDRMALGALQALWERGRRVPEEVAVVGYLDAPFAPYTIPPLTTVRVSVEQVAQVATELLFGALGGKEPAQKEVMLAPELVVRQSTAPPPAEKE